MSRELLKLISEKFTSGNSVEVERITITRAEYEAELAKPEQKIIGWINGEPQYAKPEQGEVWLPIETAPRYGRILVMGTDIGICVASAGWDNETPEKIIWGVVNDIEVTPTHWMSLPKLPTTGESK